MVLDLFLKEIAGFVYGHNDQTFRVYAVVGADRYEPGEVDLISVTDISAESLLLSS